MVDKKSETGADPAQAQGQRLAILGELLADMAHEINNLMVGVLGYADLELEEDERTEASRHNLTQILQCGNAVRDLTQNLLHFARPADPKASGRVDEAVQATLELFRRRIGGIRIVWDASSPSPLVALPTGDLRLVLANLIKNALDAMESSPAKVIKITTEIEPEALALNVWNSGPPIPHELLPRLFEPFFTTKSNTQGTGLGLSIVQRLVTQAGGNLSARNPETGGVVFTVKLPLASAPEQEGPPIPPSKTPRVEGRRVLVVDDESTVREVTRLMVSQMGGGIVETCSSGEEALNVVAQEDFDAIVLDLRMAGLSGQEVYRSLPEALQKRVVFVTGDTLSSSTEGFLAETQQPALFKPISWKELLEAVQKVATS